MTDTIPKSILRHSDHPLPLGLFAPTTDGADIPHSVLRRPDHQHPFAPFIADDLGSIERMFEHGFDPFWLGDHAVTCVMEAASRGNSASVHLAFSLCKNPMDLAARKSESGLDAFDMAAACGSVSCLWEIAPHLPPHHRSAIGRGFVWHAVQAHVSNPALADAWISHLFSTPSRVQPMDMAQALILARELSIPSAAARLESFLAKRMA